MPLVILGVDPGIADTGFGVISLEKGGRARCLEYGSIKTKCGLLLEDRLEILAHELDKIIKKYKPDRSAVEELFFNKNVKTALIVGQARGVVLLTLRQNKVPISNFTPSQVKQTVSSYGQASKQQMQRMVKIILNLKEIPRPDDAADALAIALTALNHK
jgi:crossover junction endodeoxyribonuclease RuvC